VFSQLIFFFLKKLFIPFPYILQHDHPLAGDRTGDKIMSVARLLATYTRHPPKIQKPFLEQMKIKTYLSIRHFNP
jgi:hypothetical protein